MIRNICFFDYKLKKRKPSSFITKVFWIIFVFVTTGLIIVTWRISDTRNINDHSVAYLRVAEPDTCQPILLDGTFTDEVETDEETCFKTIVNYTNTNHNCMKKWTPNGCEMHFYSKRDMLQCLKEVSNGNKYIFLIGDSRMRYAYNKIVFILEDVILPSKFKNHSSTFNKETTTGLFFIERVHVGKDFLQDIKEIKEISKNHPTIVVIGITLHMIVKYKQNPLKGIQNFKFYLQQAKKDLDEVGSRSLVLWFVQPPRNSFKAIFGEGDESKRAARKNLRKKYQQGKLFQKVAKMLVKTEKYREQYAIIPDYNLAAEQILNDTSVKMWYSAKYIGEKSFEDYVDPVHLSDYDNYNFVQILFNMFCNKHMHLNSKLCCT